MHNTEKTGMTVYHMSYTAIPVRLFRYVCRRQPAAFFYEADLSQLGVTVRYTVFFSSLCASD